MSKHELPLAVVDVLITAATETVGSSMYVVLFFAVGCVVDAVTDAMGVS